MSKILINQPRSSYFIGGAEMISLEHAKNLAEKGHTLSFVTILPSSINKSYSAQYLKLKREYNPRINFVELAQQKDAHFWYRIDPGENRDRWNVESLYFNRSLIRWMESSENVYDTMISYYKLDGMIIPRSTVGVNTLYLCGVPTEPNLFMSSFLAMYDKIIAITDEVKEYWQTYTLVDIKVVSTGVDVDRFKPINKANKPLQVLFIGRLIERKGIDAIIKACSLLSKDIKNSIAVRIVGKGPQTDELRALVRKIQIEDLVEFEDETDVPEIKMGLADICIFPSKRGEGLQGVILEAMASGSYVIASDTKINRVVLGKTRGKLVNPMDIQAIASAITQAVEDNLDRKSSSLRAVKYVTKKYSWDKKIDELMEHIL